MRQSILAGLCVFLVPAVCLSQTPVEDPQLRAEAVHLMERAARLTTPVWPANEEFFTFRVFNPAPGEAREGTIKVGVQTTGIKRWEFTYGTYKYVRVQNGTEYATTRTSTTEPAAVTTVRKMLPVFQGQFDSSDVIRRITDSRVNGVAAHCIDFDTIKGVQRQSGQVCLDAQSGFLLSIRQGNETLHQSAYFRFNDASLPGHIERWVDNQKLYEIECSVVVRTEFPPGYFDYPAEATFEHACRAFSRAYADQAPQPEARAKSQEALTVKVHGRVGKDGKPTALKVIAGAEGRPEFAEEAVRVVSKWTFHPALCEYQPTQQEMDFTVTFQGW